MLKTAEQVEVELNVLNLTSAGLQVQRERDRGAGLLHRWLLAEAAYQRLAVGRDEQHGGDGVDDRVHGQRDDGQVARYVVLETTRRD